MKLILYDFDKTIYDGDSSLDFFMFCLRKKPIVAIYIPKMFVAICLYKFKVITKTKMKQHIFSYLKIINNIDSMVQRFWKFNIIKIKNFYNKREHKNDIIISASPEFLLEPITKKYNVKTLFATDMNKYTGEINGENCYGEEKVNKFLKKYKINDIYEMYSDSYSDVPLFKLAEHAYIVKKDKIEEIYFNNKK